jgi:hypothetical protein
VPFPNPSAPFLSHSIFSIVWVLICIAQVVTSWCVSFWFICELYTGFKIEPSYTTVPGICCLPHKLHSHLPVHCNCCFRVALSWTLS